MRWRSAWLAASSVLLLAGCGSAAPTRTTKPPSRIPADVAQKLAADADALASTHGCAARNAAVRLQTDVIAGVGRIPERYREQLMSAANDVVSRVPECLPPKPDHGKHKGRKKHKKHDEDG
jgi:outer membrane murein-binding lipoprotein Lpp